MLSKGGLLSKPSQCHMDVRAYPLRLCEAENTLGAGGEPADNSLGFQNDSQYWTCRLETTEGKVQNFDRSFQQGSSDEGTVLSKKTDPNVILNLAEQRVQSLFDKFAADKTVRLTPT